MHSSAAPSACYVEAAKNLASRVREVRQDIDRARMLPGPLVDEMTEAGFFRLWMCRAYGGPELTFPEFLAVIEELSRADGSVGWCAMVASVWSRLTGYIAESAGRQIFDRNNRLAGSVNPTGKAVAVPGDFASLGAGVTAASSSIASGRSATRSCMTAKPGASTIAERRISGS